MALLPPQSPIFSWRGLPATRQFRYAGGLLCYDRLLLWARIDLDEQRLPSVRFCVPKRLKSGVDIAHEHWTIRRLKSEVGGQSICDLALKPLVARKYAWPHPEPACARQRLKQDQGRTKRFDSRVAQLVVKSLREL